MTMMVLRGAGSAPAQGVGVSGSMTLDFVNSIYERNGVPYPSLVALLAAGGGSFSRAAAAYDLGMTQLFSSGAPRITVAGLLLEPSRTNFAVQSDFASGWTLAGLTSITQNANKPVGTNNASTFLEDSSTGDHQGTRFSMPTTLATGRLINTVYARRGVGSRDAGLFMFDSAFASCNVTCNLANGVINGGGSVGGGVFTNGGAVSSVVGAFRRFGFYADHAADTAFSQLVQMGNYVGNGTSTNIYFGLQLEQGAPAGWYAANPSSHIPTGAAAVTMPADQLSLNPPSGKTTATITFSDASTKVVSALSGTWDSSAAVFGHVAANVVAPLLASIVFS